MPKRQRKSKLLPVVLALVTTASCGFSTHSASSSSASQINHNNKIINNRKNNNRNSKLKAASVAPPASHLQWLDNLEDYDHNNLHNNNHHNSHQTTTASVSSRQQQEQKHRRSHFWSRVLRRDKKAEGQLPQSAYQARQDQWIRKYATVDALRQTFGKNRNFWGDLDADRTRRLYHTLLPQALLSLHATGVRTADLAPLAYQARVAAKLYARERAFCHLKCSSDLFDGFRTWRKYGSWDTTGMSYAQVWNKYALQVMSEIEIDDDNNNDNSSKNKSSAWNEEDVTAKICWQILESSCRSNALIDKLCIQKDRTTPRGLLLHDEENHDASSTISSSDSDAELDDLQILTDDLDRNVRAILNEHTSNNSDGDDPNKCRRLQRYQTLQTLARMKRRLDQLRGGRPRLL